MPTPLPVTETLYITPLLDMQRASFATSYAQGLYWSLSGEREVNGPLPESYVMEHLETYITRGYFDGKHGHCLPSLGFYLGMVHGGVLTDRGQPRRDVTTLVVLQQRETARGYRAGREWYFYEASPRERWQTESDLIERLREVAREHLHFSDRQAGLRYAFGCVLGELSGHLFPQTAQETQAWEAAWQQALQAYEHEQAQRGQPHTEPFVRLPFDTLSPGCYYPGDTFLVDTLWITCRQVVDESSGKPKSPDGDTLPFSRWWKEYMQKRWGTDNGWLVPLMR